MKSAPPRTGGVVLVVDDDDDIREMTMALLELEGFETRGARHGLEALAYLRSHPPPHALVLDLMMPIMDGRGLRAEMRRDGALAGIPVLLVTASPDAGREAGELGVAGHFSKPVRFDALLAALRALGVAAAV